MPSQQGHVHASDAAQARGTKGMFFCSIAPRLYAGLQELLPKSALRNVGHEQL
jgi:hypothetical protein